MKNLLLLALFCTVAVTANIDLKKCDQAEKALASRTKTFAVEISEVPESAHECDGKNENACKDLKAYLTKMREHRHSLKQLKTAAQAACGPAAHKRISKAHHKAKTAIKKHANLKKLEKSAAKNGDWHSFMHHLKKKIKRVAKKSAQKASKIHKVITKHSKHPHIKKVLNKAHKHAKKARKLSQKASHHLAKGHVKKSKKLLKQAKKHLKKAHKAHHKANKLIKLKKALQKPQHGKKLAKTIAEHMKSKTHKLHQILKKKPAHKSGKKAHKHAVKANHHAGKARHHADKALHHIAKGNKEKAKKPLKKAIKHASKARKAHHKAKKAIKLPNLTHQVHHKANKETKQPKQAIKHGKTPKVNTKTKLSLSNNKPTEKQATEQSENKNAQNQQSEPKKETMQHKEAIITDHGKTAKANNKTNPRNKKSSVEQQQNNRKSYLQLHRMIQALGK